MTVTDKWSPTTDLGRPSLHIRPAQGWLNDPNGVCRIDGVYHVFFQYNPATHLHTDICWGHVSSTDLLHWTAEPVALVPRPGGLDANGCWSGCVVDDGGVPTAVYTAITTTALDAVVSLATSDRSLRSWTQQDVPRTARPDDPAISEVRDPFLFALDGRRYAVQGAGHARGSPQLLLYGCDDLEQWSYLGPLLTTEDQVAARVAPANIWECPNLFRLGEQWVVVLSLWQHDGGVHHLAGVRYLLGDLVRHETGLTFVAGSGGLVDDGPTFYAPQVLLEPDRVLLWGWAWEGPERSAAEVAEAGWAGVLTCPRELVLDGDRVVSRPARELTGLRRAAIDLPADRTVDAPAFEVVADGPLRLLLTDEECVRREVVVNTVGATQVLVDGSLVEVFGDGPSHTTRAYPSLGSRWVLEPADGVQVEVWSLSL